MGNGTTPSAPVIADGGAARSALQPPDPVPWFGSLILGIYFFGLAAITFYLLVTTWPVSDPKDASTFASFSLFGSTPFSAPSDLRLFFTVIAAGALGSQIHTITSFADFVGNRNLSKSWIWWLVLRMPIGVALALLFYLVLRGGLIVPSLPNGSTATDTAHLLNPYGIAAIAALSGMFSKQATDKLREIFDTLFRTREPVNRADPLVRAKPVITDTQPTKLAVGGPPTLNVIGRGFQPDCIAVVNGNPRNVKWVSDMHLVLTLFTEDVSVKTELQLIIQNPGPSGGDSEPFRISVENV
jgi:hypothetical protein